jgi:DNA-binding PadR family transcriptional regulator
MATPQCELLPGIGDLSIMMALALHQMHGTVGSRRTPLITNRTFAVHAGSLCPALRRLEEAGWLAFVGGKNQ